MKRKRIWHAGRRGTIVLLLLCLAAGCCACADGTRGEEIQAEQEQTEESADSSGESTSEGESSLEEEISTEEGIPSGEGNPSGEENPSDEGISSGEGDLSGEGDSLEEADKVVYCTADSVNLRAAPSLDSEVLRRAEKGEEFVRIEGGDGEWDRIRDADGNLYYAASRYLSRYNPLEAEDFVWSLDDLKTVNLSEQLYDYEEMEADLKELAGEYPDRLSVSSLGTTEDGRELFLAVLGSPDASNAIVVQAAIHAREYMTTLLTMKQLEYYLYYYDTGYYNGIPYSDIFEHTAVYLIPMLNPDGVAISQKGLEGIRSETIREEIVSWYERDYQNGTTSYNLSDYLKYFKSNANGVDLNRNFDMGWDEFTGSSAPGSDRYKGTAPGSEKESAALIDLTNSLNPRAAISYHATGSILYWDYGQTGEFRGECESLTALISGLTSYRMIYRSAGARVNAAGYSDWAAGVKEIPAVTIEIGTGRAPLSIEEFADIWSRNREVIAAVAAEFLEE